MGKPRPVRAPDWTTPERLTLLTGWAQDGLTNQDIADNIGINVATLYSWKRKHAEIDHALKKGREVADYIVQNALFQNAIGFSYEEEAITNKGDVVSVTKYSKPNVTAQIFWLKNRQADKWREKREPEQDTLNAEVTYIGLSEEQMKEIRDNTAE